MQWSIWFDDDKKKAFDLFMMAGELGHHKGAYRRLGDAYCKGVGVVKDMEKAEHYWELAAMAGDIWCKAQSGNTRVEQSEYSAREKGQLP